MNLRTKRLLFVITSFDKHDPVPAGDVEEDRAVRGYEKLIAGCDNAFELLHQTALCMWMQI